MRAGRLRHRVRLERRTLGSADVYGERLPTWALLDSVWASIESVGATETRRAEQQQIEATHAIRIRYYSGLTAKDRVVFNSRTFEILSVLNVDERNIEMLLVCKEQP